MFHHVINVFVVKHHKIFTEDSDMQDVWGTIKTKHAVETRLKFKLKERRNYPGYLFDIYSISLSQVVHNHEEIILENFSIFII